MPIALHAQVEGAIPTQALVRVDSKESVMPAAQALVLELDKHSVPVTSVVPIQPSGVQIALLIDDGLSRSAGIQLQDLRAFAQGLPQGTELLVGYMTNGRVEVEMPFTTDHAAAAAKIRLPLGEPGLSASPYFCLSDFAKHWPGTQRAEQGTSSRGSKARFAMMITDGVDPYNGSVSIFNQDSPYVQSAIIDAQRAGVQVSSVYYSDAGLGGGAASFSGQSYLNQVSEATGGVAYYQGTINPVSLKPYLDQFKKAIAETYVATFPANAQGGGRQHLVKMKLTSAKLKLRHPDQVRPGNREMGAASE